MGGHKKISGQLSAISRQRKTKSSPKSDSGFEDAES
jgi:hypothetical protein